MAMYEFPTSFGQRRMWLLAQLDPDEPTYNITWAVRLDGALDVPALRRAWVGVLDRHEALRTTFRSESGMPIQVIDEEAAVADLPVASVEELPAGEREPAARALVGELARTPMDLAAGPLVRALLVRLARDRHVLAVLAHHIVADGWSFRILFDELSADYEAIRLDGEPVGEEPEIQYADFAIWQIEHAEAGGYGPAERFWRAELAGAPAALPLPTDEPYPARPTFAGDSIDTTIDAALAERLRGVAARLGTSLFAVFLTAYAVVLARLSGSDDLLVAVPMAARTRPETERMVGLLMNTVPVRVRVDRRGSLGDLVRAVHAGTGRALAHQDLPFARVVELLRPERDPARLPLAQVMFAMEESWAVPARGGLEWRPELVDNGTTKFEIELTVTDEPAGPRVHLGYHAHLFRPATAGLVADGFDRVLRCLADDPQHAVADTQILSPATLALVTNVWPDAGPAGDPDGTALAQLWRACAGDRVVAQGSDGSLTGDEVRTAAWRLAVALRRHGVGAGDRVGILVPRGARLVPAVLGVWAAGAAYVPMDPIYPEQRLAMMLEDADARAVVVDTGVPGAPLPPAAAALAVVDLAALPPADAAGAEPPGLPPAAPAYTIFTSGSTGRPKAATVTQGGLAALLDAVRPLLALGAHDRFLAVSTFAFDIALVELLVPVLEGGCVLVADADDVLDAARLRRLLVDAGATAMQATPAGWRMLVDAGGVPDGVTLRMTAGEPLPRDLADAIGAGPGVRLWNLYGPSETTVYSGGAAVEPSPAPIEIGSIIRGTQLYVLDADARPVPPGVLGEIYIGGAGVGLGYHGAPSLTASRFVPDPFSGRPGARLYRTGDVGSWRPSGRLQLAGRADRQVKIRGYRVESGEVEAVLREHPDVAEAVVSLRGAGHDARLIGYLVTRPGVTAVPGDLPEHLRRTLPDYMVPAAFVVLPRLPLTATGKVDHRALPEPDWTAGLGQVPTAPRTPVEAQLCATVAELLNLPVPAGVTDNFFALGGHSLTATRLMARIRTAFGVDLPIRTLFADPTVAGLAAAVAAARGNAGERR